MVSIIPCRLAAFTIGLLWLAGFAFPQDAAAPPEPLHRRIDALSQPEFPWLIGAKLDDTQSLRRLSLDLRNTVPSLDELDAFLAEPPDGRWERWVNRFLADPLHRERVVDWYDKTLMQRRPFQNVDRATWINYLRAAVDSKTPLDQMLRDIVGSPWWNRSARAQQRFFLDRGGDPHAIARDVGRIFFGRDLQCAQCHDHPQLDDYQQIDYHGLLAFVSPGSLAEGKTTDEKGAEQKLQMYIEKAPGDAPFESVFNKGVSFRSATRVPGQPEQFDTYLAPDQRYQPTPKEGAFGGLPTPPVQSRRELLTGQLQGSNRAFAENWANRLWAWMFGRGLVHPLDMQHFDNPASNPELLQLLTDALVASNFNTTEILRQISLSETYQRGRNHPLTEVVDANSVLQVPSEKGTAWKSQVTERLAMIKELHAQAEKSSKEKQDAFEAAAGAWRELQKTRIAVRGELDAAENKFNEVNKKWTDANAAVDKAAAAQQSIAKKIGLLDEAAQKLEQAKALGDDADIQASIAATRAKIEAIKPQLTAAEQATATATANRDTIAASKETERANWKSVVDRVVPVEQQLHAADAAMTQARGGYQTAHRHAASLQQRIDRLERLATWFERSQELRSLQNQTSQFAAQIAVMEQAMVAMNTEKAASEQAVTQVQGTIEEVSKQREPIASKRTVSQSQKEKLIATKNQLTESKGLVADVAPIDAAIVLIDSTVALRDGELANLDADLKKYDQQMAEMTTQLDNAKKALAAVGEKLQAHQGMVAMQKQQLEKSVESSNTIANDCSSLREKVSLDCESVFALPPERALSPEQFAWSLLTATNVLNGYRDNQKSELDKNSPLPADANAEQIQARELQIVRGACDKLQGSVDGIANLFSSGIGKTMDDFFASPDQALYVANGGSVYSWAAPSGTNVTQRVVQSQDLAAGTTLLMRGLLSRSPTPQEMQWITEAIGSKPESKGPVVHELVWGILASVEFRLYP